ncbi:hypothetical protein F5146DRAFT_379711 [Armillaria mellea]|nr:hypothetical protein F5146DRAFT_379711 [Armillaria mellea]
MLEVNHEISILLITTSLAISLGKAITCWRSCLKAKLQRSGTPLTVGSEHTVRAFVVSWGVDDIPDVVLQASSGFTSASSSGSISLTTPFFDHLILDIVLLTLAGPG